MGNSAQLDGPKAKIERADLLLTELIPFIRVFCQGQTYNARLEPDADGQQALKVTLDIPPVPNNIIVIVGDILYQLRSALDQLTYALGTSNSATKLDKIYFPTGNDVTHFNKEAQNKINQLSQAAQKKICDLEPYANGKGHWIRAIHAINIMDKHRCLIPSAAATFQTAASLSFKPGIGVCTITAPKYIPLFENEFVVMTFPASTQEVHGNLDIIIDIAFGDIDYVKGEPVIQLLKVFIENTKQVIKEFDEAFFT